MLASAAALAQAQFAARLNEAQVVPASGAPFEGRAYTHYDPASQQLFYRIEHNIPNLTAAELRMGPPGFNGAFVAPLIPIAPGEISGTTAALPAGIVDMLWAGDLHILLRSGGFPAGAIRGQLTKSYVRRLGAQLDQAQVVPPSGSPATGNAVIELHMPERVLTVDLDAAGFAAPITGASIHLGAAGANGPGVINLGLGVGGNWTQTSSTALTAGQIGALLLNNMYLQVDTAAAPAGAIRGQIEVRNERFVSNLTDAAVVPPSGVPFVGNAEVTYDSLTGLMNINMGWNGPPAFAAIGIGTPGVPSALLVAVPGGMGTTWSGVVAIPVAFQEALFTGGIHLYIHGGNPANPLVRGNFSPNSLVYGYAGNTGTGPLGRLIRISDRGSFDIGQNCEVVCTDMAPLSGASLAYCEDLAGTPFILTPFGLQGQVLWGNALTGIAVASDATGRAGVTFAVPAIPALIGEDFYFQWFTFEPGSPVLGVSTSDALRIVVEQ